MFQGKYKLRLNGRRLVIPKPFRDICGDYVIISMFGDRLMCYSPKEWETLKRERRSWSAWRRFIARAFIYGIDLKGRILLMKSHSDGSGIENDAVCIGYGDHFEILPNSSSSLMDSPR
jgi:DNA-binding transcriptional regulator/RsmH inhibitor MraZ